jgi:hypothetical protein
MRFGLGFARWARPHAIGLTAIILGAACGPGDGTTLDERGRSLAHPYAPGIGSRLGAAEVVDTYESVALDFLEPYCADCHTGPSASEALDLTFERAYDDMVDVPAIQRSDLDLVEPGDPDASYLIIKMEGGPEMVGRIMPRGRAARPQSEIDVIRDWIASGAPRD